MIARATPVRRTRHLRLRGVVGLLLMSALALVTVEVQCAMMLEEPSRSTVDMPAPPDGLTVMPTMPMNGLLRLVLPRGAGADQQAGGRGFAMPSVISLEIGDTIAIRNDDEVTHVILYAFLMPGETDERTFTTVGSEVYSSGSGLHAAEILNFTTIFVSKPGTGTLAV